MLRTLESCFGIDLRHEQDLPPLTGITGAAVVSGNANNVGKNQWETLCKQIAAVLSKGIPAKSDWVLKAPATESHAIACASRLYYATINYINIINDIPNNPPRTQTLPTGPDDEALESAIPLDPPPPEVSPEDLAKALAVLDYMAAPQEPLRDEQ